jgi:hypothetical protein
LPPPFRAAISLPARILTPALSTMNARWSGPIFTSPLLAAVLAWTYRVPLNIAKARFGVRQPCYRFSHRLARLYILRGSISASSCALFCTTWASSRRLADRRTNKDSPGPPQGYRKNVRTSPSPEVVAILIRPGDFGPSRRHGQPPSLTGVRQTLPG